MKFDALEWTLTALCAALMALLVALIVIVLTSDEPVCPEGQAYVFTHNLVVGRVIVPQYACLEVAS